jgi:Uma2 family endonuclease
MATSPRLDPGPFTASDLAATPEDARKRELVDGWLYLEGQRVEQLDAHPEVTGPGRAHQDAVTRLFLVCHEVVRAHGGWATVAPMDVVFDSGHVLQPDVLYLAGGGADRVVDRVDGVVPTWVAEVSSPATRSHDLVRKRRVYEDAGVPEFWFVDLEAERVERYHHDGKGYPAPTLFGRGEVAVSRAVPDLSVPVEDLLS